MKNLTRRRFGLGAASAFLASVMTVPAFAGTGKVRFKVIKGGWWFGGQGGSGTLSYRGRRYRISVGGLSAGLVFGGSVTEFVGTAEYLGSAHDIEGVYVAIGGGAAAAGGVRGIRMKNSNGVVLHLSGKQIGLMANLDLSGMVVHLS
jgi:hypothetical protein